MNMYSNIINFIVNSYIKLNVLFVLSKRCLTRGKMLYELLYDMKQDYYTFYPYFSSFCSIYAKRKKETLHGHIRDTRATLNTKMYIHNTYMHMIK